MTKQAKQSDKDRKAAALRANLRRRKVGKVETQAPPTDQAEQGKDR